ncbi:MAG: IS1634 family transposase [Chlorobium sp.]
MAYQVRQVNKKTGVTYVYEAVSVWNKELKQSRNKQVCIGKIDPATGKIIPSKRLNPQHAALRDPSITATAQIVGPAVALNELSKSTGLASVLKSCFPGTYRQILAMASYLATQGGALSLCESWAKSHEPELAASLSSQRISKILSSIGLDEEQTFLVKWMKNVLEDDYLCYNITSISSYSELHEFIKYGNNSDDEKLPQLNLSVIFGQKTALPLFYHRIPGSINDVSTLHNLVQTFKALESKRLHFVMNKGFYNIKNIDELVQCRDRFTIGIPLNNEWLQQAIDDIRETIHGPEGYRKLDDDILYVHSRLYPWGKENRRCYLHLYYNASSHARDTDSFNEELLQCKQELESGKPVAEHQKAYNDFFIQKRTPKCGLTVTYNNEAISQHINRYAGFQALLSNGIKDPVEAMRVYRDKDSVEKCFDDLNNSLDMQRLEMHRSATADGRLFIQFITLILISELRQRMRASGLIEKYTVHEFLLEMETLTKVRYSGKQEHTLTGLTNAQREILKELDIEAPDMASS